MTNSSHSYYVVFYGWGKKNLQLLVVLVITNLYLGGLLMCGKFYNVR